MRLAALSNQPRALYAFGGPVFRLIGDANAASSWLRSAPPQEVDAFMRNPNIDESILGDLLGDEAPWQDLGEELLRRIYFALANNPRMREVYDTDTMGLDGWSGFMHGRVASGASGRAEIDPPSRAIGAALAILLSTLPARAPSINDPLAAAARWVAPSGDEQEAREQDSYNKDGMLTGFQQMRAQLTRAALAGDPSSLPKLLGSDDLAIRCSAYAAGSLSVAQMRAAFERDGEAAVSHMNDNETLWRSAESRELMRELAWEVSRADPSTRLDAVDANNWARERIRKAHPDWFADESLEIDEESLPATKGDLARVAEALGGEGAKGRFEIVASQLPARIEKANARLGWVHWTRAGALIAAAWHHL